MKPINIEHAHSATLAIALTLVGGICTAGLFAFAMAIYETLPTSAFVIFGAVLVWCAFYKAFEWRERRRKS